MQINIFSGKLAKLRSEILVVTCFQDIRPLRGLAAEIDWLYGGILSNVIMQKRMTGRLGETLLVAAQGKLQVSKVMLVGLGAYRTYSCPLINSVAKHLYGAIDGLHVCARAIELFVPDKSELDLSLLMESFLSGWDEAAKNGGKYRKKTPLDLTFVIKDGEGAKRLQQKILNGDILGKGSHLPGSRDGSAARSMSFS